ncbi:hypothetical protein FA15DRAFT_696067 [Coprinopsis marcescibilis]|uniref:X-box-binding protein 1 n=1 Tax=Coprinopsis marcescibilis TaxID=230819 RepID=A0A5C3KPX4_COPMA|nr:hypothetical protein FA15DRAFT_696067 [Coprinopsis marcescibilis]
MSFVTDSPSPSYNSPSPSPSTSSIALPSTSSSGQPPRKRSRSEMSSEERKEARAHRNRIAAQHSRDRRKAQFSWLERRVAELEEENRRLRAGLPSTSPSAVAPPPPGLHIPVLSNVVSALLPSQIIPIHSQEEDHRISRDRERERENEELKQRIKTLEQGWDAVVKALAAQGLPTGLTSTSTATAPANPPPQQAQISTSKPSPVSSSSTVTPPPTVTATNFVTGFPSPAPSHSSDFFETSSPSPSTPVTSHRKQSDDVTARHSARLDGPAAGGLILSGSQGVSVYPSPANTFIDDTDDVAADDDAKMEDLFREILVDDSSSTANGLSASELAGRNVQEAARYTAASAASSSTEVKTEGQGESLGKRKRQEDGEEAQQAVTKKIDTGRLAGDGMNINTGLDFGFDWTNPISPSTNSAVAPLTSEEMQQMLDQLDVSNMSMLQFPNELGLDMGNVSTDMPMDFGLWPTTNMAGVF